MAIKQAIFKIFNGSTWDEYHHKTDSAQVAHINSDNSATTAEAIFNGSAWTPVTLQNGTTTTTVEATKLSVKKHGNVVYMRGNVTVTATSAGTVIGNVPTGFRPAVHFRYLAPRYDTRFGVIGVSSDGSVSLVHDTNIGEASKIYYINTSWLLV